MLAEYSTVTKTINLSHVPLSILGFSQNINKSSENNLEISQSNITVEENGIKNKKINKLEDL